MARISDTIYKSSVYTDYTPSGDVQQRSIETILGELSGKKKKWTDTLTSVEARLDADRGNYGRAEFALLRGEMEALENYKYIQSKRVVDYSTVVEQIDRIKGKIDLYSIANAEKAALSSIAGAQVVSPLPLARSAGDRPSGSIDSVMEGSGGEDGASRTRGRLGYTSRRRWGCVGIATALVLTAAAIIGSYYYGKSVGKSSKKGGPPTAAAVSKPHKYRLSPTFVAGVEEVRPPAGYRGDPEKTGLGPDKGLEPSGSPFERDRSKIVLEGAEGYKPPITLVTAEPEPAPVAAKAGEAKPAPVSAVPEKAGPEPDKEPVYFTPEYFKYLEQLAKQAITPEGKARFRGELEILVGEVARRQAAKGGVKPSTDEYKGTLGEYLEALRTLHPDDAAGNWGNALMDFWCGAHQKVGDKVIPNGRTGMVEAMVDHEWDVLKEGAQNIGSGLGLYTAEGEQKPEGFFKRTGYGFKKVGKGLVVDIGFGTVKNYLWDAPGAAIRGAGGAVHGTVDIGEEFIENQANRTKEGLQNIGSGLGLYTKKGEEKPKGPKRLLWGLGKVAEGIFCDWGWGTVRNVFYDTPKASLGYDDSKDEGTTGQKVGDGIASLVEVPVQFIVDNGIGGDGSNRVFTPDGERLREWDLSGLPVVNNLVNQPDGAVPYDHTRVVDPDQIWNGNAAPNDNVDNNNRWRNWAETLASPFITWYEYQFGWKLIEDLFKDDPKKVVPETPPGTHPG